MKSSFILATLLLLCYVASTEARVKRSSVQQTRGKVRIRNRAYCEKCNKSPQLLEISSAKAEMASAHTSRLNQLGHVAPLSEDFLEADGIVPQMIQSDDVMSNQEVSPPPVDETRTLVAKQTAGYDWTWADETCVCMGWQETENYKDLSDYGNTCVDTDGSGAWCYCMQGLDWMVSPPVQMSVPQGMEGKPSDSSKWHRCTPECNFPNTYVRQTVIDKNPDPTEAGSSIVKGECISPYWTDTVHTYQDKVSSERCTPDLGPIEPTKAYASHSFYIKRPQVLVQDKADVNKQQAGSSRSSYDDVVLWIHKQTQCNWDKETQTRDCEVSANVKCVRCPDFSKLNKDSYYKVDPGISYVEPVEGDYTFDADHVPYRVKNACYKQDSEGNCIKGEEAAQAAPTQWRQVQAGGGLGQYTAAFLSCVGYANVEKQEMRTLPDGSEEKFFKFTTAYPTTDPEDQDTLGNTLGNGRACAIDKEGDDYDKFLDEFVQAEIAQA